MKELAAPMAGQIISINVKAGDKFEQNNTVLALIESMKMEVPLYADVSGVIKEIKIKEGEQVQDGDVILTFE